MVGKNQHLVPVRWSLVPLTLPRPLRRCARCDGAQPFVCSERFRVNAQKRRLDVWLIYRCARCQETWNLPVHQRTTPEALGPRLEAYLGNQAEAVQLVGHDASLLRRCGAAPEGPPDYAIVGDRLVPGLGATVQLALPVPIEERVDRMLGRALQTPRAAISRWLEDGTITVEPADRSPGRTRVHHGQLIALPAGVIAPTTGR